MQTIKQLTEAVGGLSKPSKMPGYAYGIPAKDCILGSILRQKAGSVCSKCYALKGMYVFPVVKAAQQKRLDILRSTPRQWESDMIDLIALKYRNRKGADRVFRWHDSGDIQSVAHLASIVRIARCLPTIRFWLPTRERTMVRDYLAGNPRGFPANLVVRISATMIGQDTAPLSGAVSSTVGAGIGHACPAYKQGGNCGDCRACWNNSVESVDYPLH
jgi:hypothetical protein